MSAKSELRSALRQLCRCIAPESLSHSAGDVMRRVESLPCFSPARRIVLYNALPDELPTASMLEQWSRSKTMLLPRVAGEGVMEIVQYHASELATGAYNILEPTGNEIVTDFLDSDVALIPGVAFDRLGNRLGRGKGYYDRFLRSFPGTAIGICPDFRLIDSIPAESHDVAMNYVITPSTTISIR